VGETLSLFSPQFNRSIQIEVRPEQISSDAGGLVLREVDERLGITPWLTRRLRDPRSSSSVLHPLRELLRTVLLLYGQGWRDQDDATQLCDDPVLRVAVSDRRGVRPLEAEFGQPEGLASQPTLSRLVKLLSTRRNRSVLQRGLEETAVRRLRATGGLGEPVWLDVDSIGRAVHGHQAGAEYNGHYHATCFHPLVAVLGEQGDIVGAWLRHGRAHTAEGAAAWMVGVVRRLRRRGLRIAGVRLDAGFPGPELLDALEAAHIPYVARLRGNSRLDRLAGEYNLLPWLNPDTPAERFVEYRYAAKSWSKERRVVTVVVQDLDELVARHFHLIAGGRAEELPPEELLATYRQRGTAEGRFGEWLSTVTPMLSSTTRRKSTYRGAEPAKRTKPRDPFACNEVLLLLSALAYNLVHAVRVLLERATGRGWGLMRVRERALKVAARLVRGGRRLTFVLPRSAARVHQLLWAELAALPPPPPVA